MITHEESGRLRGELLSVLAEDAHNAERLLARLDTLSRESGISAHAALLLILTHLAFEDTQARGHWESILAHRETMASAMGRDPGLRVALLDYFVNINRRLVQPVLIDLEMFEARPRAASVDSLTGLATDRAFRGALQNELRRAKRYGLSVPIALFDLDDFSRVNREFGELVGDRLLREVGILLHNKVRDIDLAARPGEDEMALILPETDRNGALLVAERFRWEVESHFSRREAGGRPVGLTLSAGIACYPDDAAAPEALLARAAQALYRAKAEGKNSVQAYQPERRRFLRFDLDPDRVEVEVLSPRDFGAVPRNLCRRGIVFGSPEPLEVGEEIEIRLAAGREDAGAEPVRMRGRVVRLEEIPEAVAEAVDVEPADRPAERFEIGVALDADWVGGEEDLLAFLEKAQADRGVTRP
ncbi:MAG: GGDEF domain-containing protein [Acidobacteriia bacterium]|nr:GGDEF domain-containing protein [Terriglobia bacterium]